MKRLDKKNTVRLIAVLIFLAVSIVLTIVMIPVVKNLTTVSGREMIKARVDAMGPLGWLLFVLLQVVQVVVSLIPGEPVEIAGGMLFGAMGGFILCMLGLLFGTVLVYYLVRAVGKPLILAFIPEEKLNHFKFMQNEKRLETLIFILFLIPGTPKDTLTYVIPLTKVKPAHFFLLSFLARIPSVISSTIVGGSLGEGRWLPALIIFAVTAAVGLTGIYFNDRLMKSLRARHSKNQK